MKKAGPRGRLLATCAYISAVGVAACGLGAAARAQTATPYTTLNFGTTGTFLTGIRGTSIVGNYVVPGSTATGGLLYDTASGQWSAMPVATANGVNYPGAIGSSPYGPSFGNQGGVLRTVGSYQTTASAPYDLSYLYDAAAAPNQQITPLAYPGTSANPTLFTIAHSTFGDTVVGDYDTRLATGNAMVYTISSGSYATNNKPGAVSTTAYGVYGDMIAGGYANAGPGGGIGFEHGYLYNQTTGAWSTYDHPGAIVTHLEGITGAGRSGEYNMVADWVTPNGAVHAGVLHVNALGVPTWYDINIPGAALVSSNSAYGDTVVGIYLLPGSTTPNGYVATIPALYNPISNTGTVTSVASNAVALSGRKGDDIVNSGTIQVSGRGGIGIRGETYGVLTNAGSVVAAGVGGAAVEMHGLYGTLLNSGTLQAALAGDAVRTGSDSFGSVIVNTGVIDGRIAATGPQGRFENSGWIGITGAGLPVTHLVTGTYVQTAAGTLSLRVGPRGNDALSVTGAGRLAGTVAVPFQTSTFVNSYDLLRATGGTTGTFETLTTSGLPSYLNAALAYSNAGVALSLTSQIARQAGLTSNQSAVGGAVDAAFNTGATAIPGNATSGALSGLYSLSPAQLGAALGALSGEAHASEHSVLINDGLLTRQAILGRLRQLSYGNAPGPAAALGYSGDALSYSADPKPPANSASASIAKAVKAPPPDYGITPDLAMWAQGYGSWGSFDRTNIASGVDTTLGGVVAGFDRQIQPDTYLGGALGYSHSTSTMSGAGSSAEVDSGLIAAYAGTSFGAWNLRGGVSYNLSQVDSSRSILVPGFGDSASGQYNAGLTQVFGELGYGMAIQTVAVEPFAGLAWAHLNTDGFTERAAALGLAGSASSSDVGFSTLGVRLATDMALPTGMVFTPHASVAWKYAFGDLTPVASFRLTGIGGPGFSVTGVPLATNAALLDVGADLRINASMKVGLSYVGEYASSERQNAVKGAFTWTF